MGRRASLDEWTQILLAHCQRDHQPRKLVDAMYGASENYTHRFLCLNASTMGIGGETAARVSAQGSLMRKFSGEARFAAAAVGALRAWRERRVRVTVDGALVREGEMNLVAVGNGPYAGGGMMLSPNARANDGKLDVVTASGLTRAAVIRELPRIHRGGHVKNPKVQTTQGERVRIETFSPQDAMLIEADGNVRGRTPVEFRIMPAALRIVAGDNLLRFGPPLS
jgi:diacylglycerol kinase family enzyme